MKILIFIFIVLGLIVFNYCYHNKVRIHFSTFFKKGFKKVDDDYGLYIFYGNQGDGKTFSVIDILRHFLGHKKVFTNVKSFADKFKNEVIFEPNLEKLISFLEAKEDCSDIVVFYDEIFSLFKDTYMPDDIRTVLTQLRKKHLYFFTSSQEWTSLPRQFRKLCRYEVTCSMFNIPFLGFAVLINKFNDGYNIHWSSDEQEYVAPRLWTSIKKCNKVVADSYDTYEAVHHYRSKPRATLQSRASVLK